jgi:RecA-family ATPase
MYSLRKFASRTGKIGRPLPDPFPSFALHRITFRHGATSMIAGNPGSFKSVLALNMLTFWARAGKTGLYFSADSDEFTVARRVGAMLTGDADFAVEQNMTNSRVGRYVDAISESLGSVHFYYKSTDMDGITATMRTFEAVYGAYPDFVVVDNLMDYVDAAGEWELMRTMTRDLDILARETKSHICILHHTSESAAPPGVVPPSRAVQGKVTQKARLVLTVAAIGTGLQLACVKNTNGPQDPTAKNVLTFFVQPSLRVEDISFRLEQQ